MTSSRRKRLVEESLEISRELGDRFQLGWALFTKGLILNKSGDREGARSSYEQALAIFRETDDVTGYALVLDGLAVVEWGEGDRRRAMTIAGAATEIRNVQGIGLADINRADGGVLSRARCSATRSWRRRTRKASS